MNRGYLRAAVLCLTLAGDGFSQDRTVQVVQGDAREAAKREMAVILLQAKLTRPTGPQTTPEQDRISELIAADYSFVQTNRAHWRGTRYLTVFDQAFTAALHEPALKKLDPFKLGPFKLEPVNPSKVVGPFRESSDRYPWFFAGALLGGIFLVWLVSHQFAKLFGLDTAPVAQGDMPPPVYVPPIYPPEPPPLGSSMPQATERPVCGICSGDKRIRCSTCQGRGWWWEAPTTAEGQGHTIYCSLCVSSGWLQCTGCNGTGRSW